MTTSPGVPVTMQLDDDVSDGFSKPGNFNPKLALAKGGNLSIDREDDHFKVGFIGKNYRRVPDGVIELDQGGVFDLVQKCRDAWDAEFAKLTVMRPKRTGAG